MNLHINIGKKLSRNGRACKILKLNNSSYYYEANQMDDRVERMWIKEIAAYRRDMDTEEFMYLRAEKVG